MPLCERRIVLGVFYERSCFGIGDGSNHFGWDPGKKRARRDYRALENYGSRCNETFIAYGCSVHDDGAHAYQDSVSNCGTVANGGVTNGGVVADGEREPRIGVEDRVVLHVRPVADLD